MSGYTLTRSAENDLAEIWDYIADANPDAADALLDRFYERFQLLATNPGLGPIHPQLEGDVHHSIVGLYVIFYEFLDDGIMILRILHGRRDIPQVFRDEPPEEDEGD